MTEMGETAPSLRAVKLVIAWWRELRMKTDRLSLLYGGQGLTAAHCTNQYPRSAVTCIE